MPSLKEKIVRGDIVLGVSVPITATKSKMEDILSKDDYDFIHTDSQHSPYSEERLVAYCETAKEVGIPVQFRIKHPRHAYLVGNILDLGPLGIEVPLVEDEATADEAINWFYYPQVAKRSWGGAARYGVEERPDRLEYAEWWNAQRYPMHPDGNAASRCQRPPTRQAGDHLPYLGTGRPVLRYRGASPPSAPIG